MGPRAGASLDVLLVWGSADRGERLASALRSAGFSTSVATDLGAVRDRVEAGRFDCAAVDHDPPAVDGPALAEQIGACDPGLPVAVVPSVEDGDGATAAVDAGVAAYLPWTGGEPPAEALAGRLREAVEDRRARREGATAAGRFGALAENLGDAVVVVDADGTVQYANPALERVLGYEPCEVRGGSLTTLMPDRFRERHAAALRAYLDTGDRALDWTGVEFPARHAEGHEVPVEVSFGEFDHGGKRFFVGSIRDRSGD